MTPEERAAALRGFQKRFRGPLLLLLTEAWACRNEGRKELGELIEQHSLRCKELLKEMFDALQPEPNGAAVRK